MEFYCTGAQRQMVYALVASALLFVDYVDLLASSGSNLRLALGQFAVMCEVAGRARGVERPLWVRDDLVGEF